MDVFEKMWKELAERLILANKWSINKTITYQDAINLMASYEEHYHSEIKSLQDTEVSKAIEQYKKDNDEGKD